MATVLRLSTAAVSSCVCASEGSSAKGAAGEFSFSSARWNPDGGGPLLSGFGDTARTRRLVCKRNPFSRAVEKPIYSSWRTPVSTEIGAPLTISGAKDNALGTSTKLTFLIDVEEDSDGSVVFKFGTVDQVLAWDRLVAFLYRGAEGASSFKRASTACQELIGVPELPYSGPTYYGGSGVIIPRWAMMKEMLRDFSQAVPMDRQVVSRSFASRYSAAAGVWERADGTYCLGGGSRTGRPGRRSPGWPETHSVGGQQVSSLRILDWAAYPPSVSPQPWLWRDELQACAQHPASRQGVIQLKLQRDEEFSLQEKKASYGTVNASTAFLWLPSQNEESVSGESLRGQASRTTKTKALRAGRVLQAPKPSSSVYETSRRQQKRGIRSRKSNCCQTTRDLFYKNPVHVLDFMLGHPFMQTRPSNAEFLLAMRKEYAEELATRLNQVAVGLAGGGLAMLLYVASRMLCVNAVFDNVKFIVVIRGVGLLWLSAAMCSLRKVVLSLKNECASLASKGAGSKQVARLKKELRSVSYKTLGVMVLSVVGAG